MAKHRGAPLRMFKRQLMEDFEKWCAERSVRMTPMNMIEFLFQEGFIQGKTFLGYCDRINLERYTDFSYAEPLREGFIPPESWIGKRK